MAKYIQLGKNFRITGRGFVYKCNAVPERDNFRVGDTFYDINENKIIISGIEFSGRNFEDDRIFALFTNLNDKKDKVKGKIISSDGKPNISFIYAANPLESNTVDDEYLKEYNSINNTFEKMIFSYEELIYNHKLKISNKIPGLAIYRGWMLRPEQYKELYDLLVKENTYLINSPSDYERCHLLPNWYNKIRDYTAKSAWNSSNNLDDAFKLLNEFNGPVMVKDYVKSRKHEWDDACYIGNPKSDKAKEVINNFITRQGPEFVGGTVLREFVNLKRIGYHEKSGMPISEEYRIFVLYDEIVSIIGYWGNAITKFKKEDIDFIEWIKDHINSNFYTIDIARKEDDQLVVIEIGDGQVSGLQGFSEDEFYNNISNIVIS